MSESKQLVGLELSKLYPLDTACKVLEISDRNMKRIRRKYINRGILAVGHSFLCVGADLLSILEEESRQQEVPSNE